MRGWTTIFTIDGIDETDVRVVRAAMPLVETVSRTRYQVRRSQSGARDCRFTRGRSS